MRTLGKHRIATLMLGTITALVIVFSQLFYFQAADYCQQKAKTDQHTESSKEEATYISIPSSTISSSQTIQLNQDFTFVLEILFDGDEEQPERGYPTVSLGKIFRTLFSVIIAPNAP